MNWVPWNSYYFHASFACSFVWILKAARYFLVSEVYDWKKFGREFLCVALAGIGAFWGGTLQFALLYHPAHDIFGIHSEYTSIAFLAIYAVIVYIADRSNRRPEARAGNPYFFDELSLAVCIHYMFYMMLVLVADPQNIVSEGLHQPIGPCNVTQKVQTPTGAVSCYNFFYNSRFNHIVQVLYKNKYLCPDNYDEKYFDFHCLPANAKLRYEPGDQPLEWYAICGTPFENRAEYTFIIWYVTFFQLYLFNSHFRILGLFVFSSDQFSTNGQPDPVRLQLCTNSFIEALTNATGLAASPTKLKNKMKLMPLMIKAYVIVATFPVPLQLLVQFIQHPHRYEALELLKRLTNITKCAVTVIFFSNFCIPFLMSELFKISLFVE